MNFRKDVQSLTEAYKQIAEAPTDPGPSFGDETAPPEDVKYLDKKGALSDEDKKDVLNKIVKEVKDMLESYEESHFPGSFKDFRDKIAEIVLDVYPPAGRANAGYTARVIQNYLRDAGVIVDEKSKGVKVNTVSGAVDEPIAKAAAAKPAATPKAVTGFELSAKYDVDRDVPMTVSDDAKMAHQNLLKQGMLFGQHTGKDLVKASGLSYPRAKVALPELEKAGAIIKAEKEARDDEDIEALDYGEEDPSRVAFDLTKGGTDTIGTDY